MKKFMMFLLILVVAVCVYAQDEVADKWTNSGQGALQFSQASFSNWAAGGVNALSLNAFLTYSINYKHEKLSWDNNLDLGYGFQISDGVTQKTDDKIDLSSTFAYEAGKNWAYTGMFSFKTQIMPGYSDTVLISNFMAPAYMLVSAGMTYKPGDIFKLTVSPLTGKMTVVADQDLADLGAFGVDTGKKFRAEFGGFIKTIIKKEIIENVLLQTKLELFANYFDSPLYLDVNWDLMLSMKINKYLTTNISTQLIYDHDVNTNVQFKEMFTFGLSFAL
ncbi:MAG: DUF3078 domain-containing protein [Candidatus Marinimicrobia bacterium]|nr:DUF3078 domain-containing protein [Candidatus Neomarinimicrobiota bacterium]